MNKKEVTEFDVGERLDKTLAGMYPEYSRSALEKLIESGDILVNDEVKPAKYKLKSTDAITVNLEPLERPTASIELPILYEDEDVIVINKPVGILAHTKGTFSKEGTVASWLKNHVQLTPNVILSEVEGSSENKRDPSTDAQDNGQVGFWESNRAGIVHRLDRGTSGVMIVAKNEESQKFLQKQFAKRNVKKTYVAVVTGEMPQTEGLIDVPIERNPKKPATFRAGVNGKSAQTEFKVTNVISSEVERSDQISPQDRNHINQTYSLLELKPRTGRTHQLRVHLAHLKHPIVGDEFYSGEPAKRLLLHAKELEITLPGGNRQTFTAPVPTIFKEYVQ